MTSDTLREVIMRFAANHPEVTVQDAYLAVRNENPGLTEELFVQEVRRLESEQGLELREVRVKEPFMQSLGRWEVNLWLYGVISLTIVALIGVYVIPAQYGIIRWVFGSVFILFVPGFASTRALFSKGLPVLVGVLLSVGLSIVLILIFGFLLNFLPGGINILSVTACMSAYSLIAGFLGSWRKYRSLLST